MPKYVDGTSFPGAWVDQRENWMDLPMYENWFSEVAQGQPPRAWQSWLAQAEACSSRTIRIEQEDFGRSPSHVKSSPSMTKRTLRDWHQERHQQVCRLYSFYSDPQFVGRARAAVSVELGGLGFIWNHEHLECLLDSFNRGQTASQGHSCHDI